MPDLEIIAARIKAAPPPPKKLTKRQQIESLKPFLKEAISKGHTPDSLVALLASGNVPDRILIAKRTLEDWLELPRRKRATKRTSSRQ